MTINEYIKTLDNNTVVHIGSAANYFFVGNKQEYYTDISTISAELKTGVENKIYRLKHLFSYNNVAKSYKEWLEHKNYNKNYDDTYKHTQYRKYLSKRAATIQSIKKNLPIHEKYLENWQDIEDRVILRAYKRTQNDGIVLIVEGTETGNYWDLSEYRRGREIVRG